MTKKLHIFNPEHDIALASNLANFTAPHAGRHLRSDLGWLPALWAAEDDFVLVDNIDHAQHSWRRIRARVGRGDVCFVEKADLLRLGIDRVAPWGWDLALRAYLLRNGVLHVPSEQYIADVRRLSHRRTAAQLLSALISVEGTVGDSREVVSVAEVNDLVAEHGRVVVKAPWSSSGRGLRFLNAPADEFQQRWLQNVIAAQGSVMIEPQYDRVRDFGLEFEAADNGIRYLGLSLFHTKNGAYTGNVLTSEEDKRDMISRYVSIGLLDDIQGKILSNLDLGTYRGPFGIDMMVVRNKEGVKGQGERGRLHPCVEINLRRTMGHVALALTPADDVRKVMRIDFNGQNYKLKINKL